MTYDDDEDTIDVDDLNFAQLATLATQEANAFCSGEGLSRCEKRICKTHRKQLGKCKDKKNPENCAKFWNDFISRERDFCELPCQEAVDARLRF